VRRETEPSLAAVDLPRPFLCPYGAQDEPASQRVISDVKPILQALILADHIYRDTATGKHVIAGTFNRMVFVKGGAEPKTVEIDGEEKQVIPGGMQAGSPYVYISLTDLRGKVRCTLRYVNLEQDKALLQIGFSIECTDPLQTVELVLPMPKLPPVAGVHALELLCNDEPIGSHRITVEELKERGDVDDSSE